ncbi:hypothetical protein [Magnetococcus sp. PR-3]|uniref:hypothetical protein n=1 Tax=Magnetococcus sp. PR-3 TaxID=3120355 RepID=UPI002FCE2299
MKLNPLPLLVAGLVWLVSSSAWAAPFPADWASWHQATTPLTQIGALPGCEADVSAFPPIYQETVATYCNVKPGGPGKVGILISPTAMDAFKSRQGGFKDGPQMILHLQDLKVLFLTYYQNGQAEYAVFTEDGKDITAASGPLSAETCKVCHTGYEAFCVHGQCGQAK